LENIAARETDRHCADKLVRANFVTQLKTVALQGNVALRINVQHLDVTVTLIPIVNLVNTVASMLAILVALEKGVHGTTIVELQERNAPIQTVIVFIVVMIKSALNYPNINVLTKTVVIPMTTAMYLVAVITAVKGYTHLMKEAVIQIVSRNFVTKTVIVVVPVNAATLIINATNVQIMFPHG
jgi:hypothetical protein